VTVEVTLTLTVMLMVMVIVVTVILTDLASQVSDRQPATRVVLDVPKEQWNINSKTKQMVVAVVM
jgi:hypothetical protein